MKLTTRELERMQSDINTRTYVKLKDEDFKSGREKRVEKRANMRRVKKLKDITEFSL